MMREVRPARRRARARPAACRDLLPEVLVAGQPAGELTSDGAALLDPSGRLRPGVAFCPPEGDAGTGMVATDSVAPAHRQRQRRHEHLRDGGAGAAAGARAPRARPGDDAGRRPGRDGALQQRCERARGVGRAVRPVRRGDRRRRSTADDGVRGALPRGARRRSRCRADSSPTTTSPASRSPASPRAGRCSCAPPTAGSPCANFMRAQLYGVFGTLALGMRVLAGEGRRRSTACSRTAACSAPRGSPSASSPVRSNAPVAVGETASEGGAWGIAVLASYLSARRGHRSRHLPARARLRRLRVPHRSTPTPRTSRASPPTSTATAPASPSSAPPSTRSERADSPRERPKDDLT